MLSRRVFMKNGGLALLSLGFAPAFLARTVEAAAARRRILITIFQRGAVDGLNMVVPFGERDYYAARPEHRHPERPGGAEGAVDLDGFFGLHPRLAPLKPLWDTKQLAIVHASGSPDGTRSHFDAQDYMETATPGIKSTQDGWLNRYLHAREHAEATPFRAVALAGQLPRALHGTAPALAIGQIGQFGIRAGQATDMVQASFESEYAAAADKVLNKTGGQAFDAVRMLKSADPLKYQPENGAEYPRSGYGDALRQIAQLVKADVGLEVAFAEAGGWDTHVNQGVRGRAAGAAPGRFRPRYRGPGARSRRSHVRRRHSDDERVRTRGGGERQPRHGSRARQRHDDHRRPARPRRQGLRPLARPGTRAALRRPRPRRHDGLPQRVRGSGPRPPRGRPIRAASSRDSRIAHTLGFMGNLAMCRRVYADAWLPESSGPSSSWRFSPWSWRPPFRRGAAVTAPRAPGLGRPAQCTISSTRTSATRSS